MLNVSLTDNEACQLIYGHPWNCLSDAWRGWLTSSGRVNKHRQPDKRERGRDWNKERASEGEPLGWMRRLRVTLRKHGRHLFICPEDTRPDTNYFIWLFCSSEDLYQCTNKFLTFLNKFDICSFFQLWSIRCLCKISFSMCLQATKTPMLHLSSVISFRRVCPYFALLLSPMLGHQASTPFVSISCHCSHLACIPIQYRNQQLQTLKLVHAHTTPAAPQYVLQPHIPP